MTNKNKNILLIVLTTIIGISFFTILIAPVIASGTDNDYIDSVWQRLEYGSGVGLSNIHVIDIDDDGKEEIIFGGSSSTFGGNDYFFVVEHSNGDYVQRWVSKSYSDNGIRLLELANLDGDADYEIYVILSNGSIEIYDGTTLELLQNVNTQAINAIGCDIADVDNDGSVEFVISGENYLHVYNGTTYTQEWETTTYGGQDVVVGDVDGDGVNEIVTSEGYVIDGINHSEEWSYVGGFGYKLALEDIDNDTMPEIIGMESWNYITAFDGDVRSPKWQIKNTGDNNALYVTDIDGDGEFEILMGSGQWGDINCYDSTTQTLKWNVHNPEHGVTNIVVGDPDGDGAKEVLWGAGHTSTGPDHLYIANTTTLQIEWENPDLDGPFSMAVSDVDNDGVVEIVSASRDGAILVFDSINYSSEWISNPIGDIFCLKTVDVDDDGTVEIIIGGGHWDGAIKIYDGITHQNEWQGPSGDFGAVYAMEIGDVDADGNKEIVSGDSNGYITIFDGITHTQEWQSIDTGDKIGGIELTDVDNDGVIEIVFFSDNGIVQIYDGVNHTLEWQSTNIAGCTALEVDDIDEDGVKEIIAGTSTGYVKVVDGITHETEWYQQFSTESIRSIAVENIDSEIGKEIILGTSTLQIINSTDLSIKWESNPIGEDIGKHNNLVLNDIDADQFMDILVGSSLGIYQFELREKYLETTPPNIVTVSPAPNCSNISIDLDIGVTYNEVINEETLNNRTVIVYGTLGGTLSGNISYNSGSSILTFDPSENFIPNDTITVTLTGNIQDLDGNGLDGNNNGISEGSPADDYSWTFTSGAAIDTKGPAVANIVVEPESVWAGLSITLTATVDDTSNMNSNIIAVECFIDNISLNGTGIALDTIDGAFDSVTEEVLLKISTKGWSGGNHTIYLHGKDAKDNWGGFQSVDVYVIPESPANWPTYQGDVAHTGYNKAEIVVPPFSLSWSKNINNIYGSFYSTPIIYNDMIYYGGHDKKIHALSVDNGSEMWSADIEGTRGPTTPCAAYGTVYMGNSDNQLYAFEALTGDLKWNVSTSGYIIFSPGGPVAADGLVYFCDNYGINAFDAFSGDFKWHNSGGYLPAISDGVVFVSPAREVCAYDTLSGNTLWAYHYSGSGGGQSVPVVANRIVYNKDFWEDYILALDVNTGKELWTIPTDYIPAVMDNLLFNTDNGTLHVLDSISGSSLWNFTGDGSLSKIPIIANGFVYVSSDKNVYAVDLETHNSVWNYSVGGWLAIANGNLYVTTSDGYLYAFQPIPQKGDLDGDGTLTRADAAIALRIAATRGWDPAADVDGDGRITSLDALRILRAAAGAISL